MMRKSTSSQATAGVSLLLRAMSGFTGRPTYVKPTSKLSVNRSKARSGVSSTRSKLMDQSKVQEIVERERAALIHLTALEQWDITWKYDYSVEHVYANCDMMVN